MKTPKIREFERANLQQKSIRLEPSGVLKESMVFSQIDYKGIVEEEEWEDSVWYETLTQRFLFVVFRKSADGDNKKAILEKVFFWTMPQKDLTVTKMFWEDTKAKIAADDFTHFWKLGDHNICHVRPKAKDNTDTMEAPSGRMVTKKGYWLNAEYILSVVNANMHEPVSPEPSTLHVIDVKENAHGRRVIPLYNIRAACGKFLYNEEAEVKGWIYAEEYGLPHGDNIFVAQAKGHSMEPKIHDGDYCVFAFGTTFYDGDIILAEIPDRDSEYGGSFTIKKYTREKAVVDGVEQKVSVTLVPLNPDYDSMSFDLELEDKPNMVGSFRKVIRL